MFDLCDIKLAVTPFLLKEKNSDMLLQVLDADIRAYQCLEIPVARFSGEGFDFHHARCTGSMFRAGQKRSDWVWIRKHPGSDTAQPGSLNGRILGRLNALFKLKGIEGKVYRLAHVSLLHCIGGTAVHGVEGMLRVGWPTKEENEVIRIAQIEGMAHLIPLEPAES